MCQAICYIMCFRLPDILQTKGGIAYLATLKLESIVACRLKPLLVIQRFVVKEFSRIMSDVSTHQY